MLDQPSANEILLNYTLYQLIELAKEKAQIDLQQQRNETRNLLDTFSQTLRKTISDPIHTRSQERHDQLKRSDTVTRKVHRKKKEEYEDETLIKKTKNTRQSADKVTKTTEPSTDKKISLGAHLTQLLNHQPMSIESIMTKLDQRGHVSKSKDPRRVLYLELKKQINKGNVTKSSRGMYAKA